MDNYDKDGNLIESYDLAGNPSGLSTAVPVAAGAVASVAIGGTEAAVGLTGLGVAGCAATEICSESVKAGLNNAQANAIAAAEEVRKATNAILAKSKGNDGGNGQHDFGSSSQVSSTPPDPDDDGVKLTRKAKQIIGNLSNLKDKNIVRAVSDRGNGTVAGKVSTDLQGKTVGEIANLAAQGNQKAKDAIKLLKDAARLSQKY